MRATPSWVVVCALSIGAASATPAFASTPPSTEGHLVTRHDGKVIDVPLEHTDVHLRVDGYLAEATVTQRFRNPYADKIEAVYLFPLPTGAAVSEMTIRTGDRIIHGSIEERAKATRIYEAARSRGLVAALLTEERPNLFTQSIANLEPAATIEVTLHYVERLAYQDGGYELVFPMVAGPRYLPAGTSGGGSGAAVQPQVLPPGLRSSHDISLAVELDAGVPIERIRSTSHQIAIDRTGPRRATVRIQPGDTIPNKDFVLRYDVAGAAPRFGVLGYRDGGEGSFLLVAQPPASLAAPSIAPREVIFALDTSSSMRGAPLAKAKALIRAVLARLRPDDTFQIVQFDDRASTLGPAPIANKPRNVQLTLDWLAALDAGGGTEMANGLETALAVPHDPARLRLVVFLSDGFVGNEDQILARVGDHLGPARLFCIGIGSAVNHYLLEELAAVGRGAVQVVRPDEDTAAVVDEFEHRIDAPVLTDLRVDWGGLAVTDVIPHAIPDLFVGQPLAIAGHYAHGGRGVVTVHGQQAGRDVQFEVPVELPDRDAARPAIATVWARQRIAELSRRLIRKDDPALVREIVALSLRHRLLTRYTAFVAVDESRVTRSGDARRVAVPVEVPDAVRGIGAAGGGGFGFGTVGYGSFATIGHGSGGGYGVGYGGGSGMLAVHAAAIPQIRIGQAVVVGDLDKSLIRRYVRRSFDKIRYCYEKALRTAPKLAGTAMAHFTISERGKVLSSTVDGLGNPDVEACIADAIEQIEFPSTEGGGTVRVNYPLNLQPAP